MNGAGARNRRITFQRFSASADDYGGETQSWTDYATAFASVSYGTGLERRQAAQESASIAATFRVLRNPLTAALSTRDRISFDGGTWDITSVAPTPELNRHLDVTATRAAD